MRHRHSRVLLAAASVLILAATPSCASVLPVDPAAASTGWKQGADFPLAPREAPVTVWTGEEVFIVGGHIGAPCPDNASCALGELTADGAAYDPDADTWREIAPAPVELAFGAGVHVDGTLFVSGSVADGPGILLSYDIATDRWQPLEIPAAVRSAVQPSWYALVTDGERVLLVSGTDENGEVPDLAFDPAAGDWSELPADPLGPAFDRMLTPTDHGLVLTGRRPPGRA